MTSTSRLWLLSGIFVLVAEQAFGYQARSAERPPTSQVARKELHRPMDKPSPDESPFVETQILSTPNRSHPDGQQLLAEQPATRTALEPELTTEGAEASISSSTESESLKTSGSTDQPTSPQISETPESQPSPDSAEKEACPLSRALNLGVTKALKRPATNNPLDSFTYIAGIRCRGQGIENQDFMFQSTIPALNRLWDNGVEMIATFYPDATWSSFESSGFSTSYITSIDVYTERAGMWKGGQFHFTTAGFTTQDVNFEIPVNNVVRAEVSPANEWRIFELWYGQRVIPQLELRLGWIYPWVKQASHQTSGVLQNQIFDYPGLFGTTEFTGNFLPYAQAPFGMQALYNPNSHHQVSLFIGDGKADPSGGFEPQIWDIELSSDDGLEIIAEYAYLNHSKDPTKMPGYYKIGFQANTGKFFNYDTTDFDRSGIYGGYITLEQMIYAEPTEPARSQGLFIWGKAVYSPNPRNIVEFAGSAGLSYAGLIPGRDRDVFAIGLGHADYNNNAADINAARAAESGLDRIAFSGETVLEAVYQAQLTPWLMLIASYQYIIDASPLGVGNPDDKSGHVFLLNTRMAF
ncbi:MULTISPECIES: carbohydrate porin [Aphanothece]|uniref:carbohydrate porin n=1 Tax=Aphanothece TaxID=1121 RepID=UPI00398E4025